MHDRQRTARAARWAAAIAIAVMVMGAIAPAAGAASSDSDGAAVVVRGAVGASTTLAFDFPERDSTDHDAAVVNAVMHALDSTSRAGSSRTHGDTREYRLTVDVARPDGRFRARIAAATLALIARASGEPVRLQIPAGFQVVDGSAHHLSDGIVRRYELGTDRDLVYGIGAHAVVGFAALLVAILLAGIGLVGPYARRVERSRNDDATKVQRLRVVSMTAGLSVIGLMIAVLFSGWVWVPGALLIGAIPATADWEWLAKLSIILGILFPMVALLIAFGAPVQGPYRRLRQIEKPTGRRRARLIAFATVPITFFIMIRAVAAPFGGAGAAIATLVYLVLALTVWPALAIHVLPTRELDPQRRERLLALCKQSHARIRDILVLEGRAAKTANAMLLGVGRLRYVVITDYLIDGLDDDELDAVVLHEIAHAKQHHLLKKVGAVLVAIFVASILAAALAATSAPAGIVVVGFALLFFVSIFLVQGVVGVRLETKADEFAAAHSSADAMRRALDRLAELNMAKRHTGALWNLLTQHPGFDQRLRRAAEHAPDGAPARQSDQSLVS